MVLIGMMGSGKSTVGRIVADRTGRRFVDTDELVVAATGRSAAELFSQDGEEAFRVAESAAIRDALAGDPAVVSVGGGAVLEPANRAELGRAGAVVWLRARLDTLAARVGSGHGRPLLAGDPVGALRRISQQRESLYAEMADVIVEVDGLTPTEVADAVVAGVEE